MIVLISFSDVIGSPLSHWLPSTAFVVSKVAYCFSLGLKSHIVATAKV